MTKEQSKDSVKYGLAYFYEIFKKKKLKFPKSFFPNLKTRKRNVSVNYSLFKNLIVSYLDNYFDDFYNQEEPMYFPLSGKLKMNKGSQFFVNTNKKTSYNIRSITWTWFFRPTIAYFSNIKLIKMKGSTSKVGRLEREYRNIHDVEDLQKVNSFMNKIITEKLLYNNA